MREEHLIENRRHEESIERERHNEKVQRFLTGLDARALNRSKHSSWATCRVCGIRMGLKRNLPKRKRRNIICRDCQRREATKIAQSDGGGVS